MAEIVLARHSSGRVVHVSEVPSGYRCQCVCIDCNGDLIAHKGARNEHHFKHEPGRAHNWAWESHLHAYAKQLIVDAGGLWVPLHTAVASHLGMPSAMSTHLRASDAVVAAEVTVGEVRPDLSMKVGDREITIALEVKVTHECDEAKVRKFGRQRLAALEIDLSRFPVERFDKGGVAAAVLTGTSNKVWLWPLPPVPTQAPRTDAWSPVADKWPSSQAAAPGLPRFVGPPRPLHQGIRVLRFQVRPWRADVHVSMEETGQDGMMVHVRELKGRLATGPTEYAAARIGALVEQQVRALAPGATRVDPGRWLIPLWHAAVVAEALTHEAAGYPVREEEQFRADEERLELDLRVHDTAEQPPVVAPTPARDNAYARRRG